MSEADAARRRQLQARLYAPGGALTPEETEELRMLSAPRSDGDPASTDSATRAATIPTAETDARAPEVTAESERMSDGMSEGPQPGNRNDAATGATTRSTTRRPHPRWLLAVVTAAALILGLGVGWLTVPHATAHAAPEMTAEQQRIQSEIAESGEVDGDTLEFAGERYGAAVWTAFRGKDRCVVIVAQGQRGSACGSAGYYLGGEAVVAGVNDLRDGDTTRSVNALLAKTVSGDWAVIVQQWESDVDDDSWQQQYSDAEMRLIGALQDAGFDGRNLTILGRDGDLPIWFDYGADNCVIVVDADTLDISKACRADDAETVELPYQDAIYSVKWTERRGPVLTIIRTPKARTFVSCDAVTGECTSIDDKTGDIG